MRFFIPKSKDEVQAVEIYEGARTFCEKQTGWKTTNRRIFSVRYRHNGVEYLAQVGSLDYTEGLVICIFETPQCYLVCTPNRGVLRGYPILAGKNDVSDIESFEE